FLCAWFRAARALHSFPTRRSSDLGGGGVRGLAAARVRGRELRPGGGAPAWARVAPGADAGIRTAFGSARAGARPCGNGFGGGPCPTTAPVPGRHGTPAGAHRRRLRNGPART